jgi:phosphatidylglycerophosphate synthase
MARQLARFGVRPNTVSVAGALVAVAAGIAMSLVPVHGGGDRLGLLLLAAAAIQVRLLCNLLDGMLAVEENLKGPAGEIYNDLPDRIADVVILAGAGYSVRDLAFGVTLGWAAAVLAVFTAYVRLLGGALGATQHFIGPMAKQQRMFTLTLAVLLAAGETLVGRPPTAIRLGLVVIGVGSIVTVIRRLHRIVTEVGGR